MKNRLWKKLIGGKIVNISRICNLVSLEIASPDTQKIYIHIQSFFRMLKDEKIILSSEDMYRCGKDCEAEKFQWDQPGNSIFDDCTKEHLHLIRKSKIVKVDKKPNGDLILDFENGLMLQLFIDTTEKEEKYRVFDEVSSITIDG